MHRTNRRHGGISVLPSDKRAPPVSPVDPIGNATAQATQQPHHPPTHTHHTPHTWRTEKYMASMRYEYRSTSRLETKRSRAGCPSTRSCVARLRTYCTPRNWRCWLNGDANSAATMGANCGSRTWDRNAVTPPPTSAPNCEPCAAAAASKPHVVWLVSPVTVSVSMSAGLDRPTISSTPTNRCVHKDATNA